MFSNEEKLKILFYRVLKRERLPLSRTIEPFAMHHRRQLFC